MYILNGYSKVAHYKPTLEQCNVDQVKERAESLTLPPGYTLCGHCKRKLDKELLSDKRY